MADAPLKRLRGALTAFMAVVLLSSGASATYPVIDEASIAKLSDQLSKLQEQIDQLKKQTEWMTTMSRQLQDQIDAIGEAGRITLPMLNLGSLRDELARNAQCLAPDLASIMPGLKADDLRFGSICDGRQVYERALWVDPDAAAKDGTITWKSKAERRGEVEARREALFKKTASEALAQGDLAATKQAKANELATEELRTAAEAAKNQNDRLAVIAQGQVLANRQFVQQNQLLARLVKIQATMLVAMTQPVNGPSSPSEDEE